MAWMPLSCGWNDMNAAFMSYERAAGPGPAVTGMHKSLMRHYRHHRPMSTPGHNPKKLK
jgi:hypothetical protein